MPMAYATKDSEIHDAIRFRSNLVVAVCCCIKCVEAVSTPGVPE